MCCCELGEDVELSCSGKLYMFLTVCECLAMFAVIGLILNTTIETTSIYLR